MLCKSSITIFIKLFILAYCIFEVIIRVCKSSIKAYKLIYKIYLKSKLYIILYINWKVTLLMCRTFMKPFFFFVNKQSRLMQTLRTTPVALHPYGRQTTVAFLHCVRDCPPLSSVSVIYEWSLKLIGK